MRLLTHFDAFLRQRAQSPHGVLEAPVMEIIGGLVTAPDVTQTALTMFTGNSLTIRSLSSNNPAKLLTHWVDKQIRGLVRVRSPRMSDGVQGLRFDDIASEVQPHMDPMFPQTVYPQDILSVDLSGSNVGGDIETWCALIYYPDAGSVNTNMLDVAGLKSRWTGDLFTVENSLATGTAGGWSGEETIATDFDLMKANTQYALIGYTVSPVAGQTVGECAAVRWRGVDTGNYGVGGPGTDTDRWLTNRWFLHLSERSGFPCIPVFNSANRNAILIDAAQDENGLDVLVTSIFAVLK